MPDRHSRAESIRIASGEHAPNPDLHEKVILYGLLGRGIGEIDKKSLDVFLAADVSSFWELSVNLSRLLIETSAQSFGRLPPSTRYGIDVIFTRRFGPKYGSGTPVSLKRLELGAANAGEIEAVTLRTIARLISEGHEISLQGLLKSYKTPMRLAMVHMLDLDAEFRSRSLWLEENGGDNGAVLDPQVIILSKDQGLRLDIGPGWPEWSRPEDKQEHGPHIGCPASFDSGYIRKIHDIASLKAVEAGLIKVCG